MKKILLLSHLILILFSGTTCQYSPETSDLGHLIVIGGGSPRPAAAMRKFVELAGGGQARIAIIPMGSEFYLQAGERYEQEFLSLGAAEARAFYISDRNTANADSTVTALNRYSGYFFSGGDQNRLTDIFLNTRSLQVFHRKYREGAVVGGTSAGAAVMSEIMITGDGNWSIMREDSVAETRGFGFLKNVIIDQHFIQRSRFNRLLSLVIQHRIPGIGIDQRTAVWIKPGQQVDVFGESVVTVISPREAFFPDHYEGGLLTARNLKLELYRQGESFRY